MGTETKLNCYTENTTSAGIVRVPNKVVTNSSTDQKTCSGIKNSSAVTSPSCSNVPFVPIHIDENDVIEGAKQIITSIRPSWNLNYVQFKKFTDGITNKLVGCFYNPPEVHHDVDSIANRVNGVHICSEDITAPNVNGEESPVDENNDSGNLSDADAADTDTESHNYTNECGQKQKDVILVRIYGNKTDLLIDRKAETRNIILLHSYGFAPTLYATFKNGLVYDFVPGVTLNPESVLLPEIWSLVAQRMADMHRVVKPDWNRNAKPVPMLWKKTQSFFDLVPERFTDADKHKRLEGVFLPIKRMRDEFAELYKRLESLDSPVVFAHNDLLLGNVVYTESRQTVTFIDYEYADYNFQAFDIGNHFTEFAGVDTVDYTRYPSRDFQLKWLRVYLQTYLQKSDVTDAEVERLYVQVNQFALASHFFWVIWCLIQAEHSTIDFDYVDYAFLRYNEYLARKDEFLSLDERLPKCKI
ncbi:ethanolamine kinase [Musca vetustissima]|uniref:ethanolamine kinase n=1 Tax=Musca vetustissima TaxID=27455 RepID=UPI002AB6F5CD|nr:ethanolamine kinase [Musca vetustissima]